MGQLRLLLKNTAVRLSALYILLFAVCAAGLVFYIGGMFDGFLRDQAKMRIGQESASLLERYDNGGMSSLLASLERRSRQPGANLYLILSPESEILAGNVRSIDKSIVAKVGWVDQPFRYQRFTDEELDEPRAAIAQILILPNGLKVLVGRDLGDPRQLGGLIRQALIAALGIMGAGAIIIWLVVGRNALKRIGTMSEASHRIMAGDLSQRLPISGSGDDFDRLSTSLNAMLDRIEKLNVGLKQVSDNIAHDLKTPLTRLRNKAADALLIADEPEECTRALEGIIQESDQLIRTFNALLMISRVEAGSSAAEMQEIDLSSIVNDSSELYEPVAEEAGLALTVDVVPNVKINGNRELIGQALVNLIDNAVKYAADGGTRIHVVLTANAKDAVLQVIDDGPGIPQEKYEEAKKRFVRLDESRTKPGTGLGLSMVEAVAGLHNGRLELGVGKDNNQAGKGLRVSIYLPLLV